MRSSHNNQHLSEIGPKKMSRVIEQEIKMEALNLEAHQTLGNLIECLIIKHRIADHRINILLLRGDLPD